MKKLIALAAFAVAALSFQSCESMEGLDKDPNRPTQVTPDLLLNGALVSLHESPWNDVARWNQYNACNYNYYGNQEYNWTGAPWVYPTLKNIQKMEEEALRLGLPEKNAYSAMGKFLKAVYYYRMTMLSGDIPMSEALQPDVTLTPKYDTQKQVFLSILNMLDEANSDMADLIASGNDEFSGDIYYGNDLASYRRANNAFTLRVLIALSKKSEDADLNVKGRFATIVNNPSQYPLFATNGDNMEFVYNSTFNKYPTSPDNFGFDALRYNMAATSLNTLAGLEDPRTFLYAEPAAAKIAAGVPATSYSAFVGAPSDEDLADMSTKVQNGEYSLYNRYRWYRTFTAQNTIILGYAEQCFNIAEAAHRGWLTASAATYYQNGIEAVMAWHGIVDGTNTVNFLKSSNDGDLSNSANYNTYTVNFNKAAYLASPAVAYTNSTSGLEKILLQRYLAFFQNSGWEGYYQWRRTGVPAFDEGGSGTGNGGKIPKRFLYPTSEVTNNADNMNEALQRQFGTSSDDINHEMWIIK
jgi:hypothetical protein